LKTYNFHRKEADIKLRPRKVAAEEMRMIIKKTLHPASRKDALRSN
jgi:hypothetical protein